MIHDAFQSLSYWNGFMSSPQWQGVIIDTHIYQVFSVGVSLKFIYLFASWLTFQAICCRAIKWPMRNTSHRPAALDHRSSLLASGLSLANGRQWGTIVPRTSTVVELVQDMMGHSLDRPTLEVVMASLEKHLPLVQAIRLFWDNFGRRRPWRMRRVKDGSNGRGKQRTQTSGHIKLDWQMVGFHTILQITNSQIFVGIKNVRTRTFLFFSTISCTTLHEHHVS